MDLGVERGKVSLLKYDRRWCDAYRKISDSILKATELESWQIEHVGSTSIIGCHAKPIIDVLIGVGDYRAMNHDFFRKMRSIGFHRLKVEKEDEIVMASFKDEAFSIHTCFIHLVSYRSSKWDDMLEFRNALNADAILRDEYVQLKSELKGKYANDRPAYTQGKEAFIKRVLGN
ncbi:GrpB family protein [Salinicoccus sp. ID82-1]|uniref:GrpB family protein n=1 Tax=Salinicoccus sp. ID82-1 TaxID=2820269 RepID=UPI001F2F41E4|nr:GrpB family protein [Salinicoccus sp. ID82-1]MCG1008950.1 GrpB family protein [Salinicoccus sp. ID82-1]